MHHHVSRNVRLPASIRVARWASLLALLVGTGLAAADDLSDIQHLIKSGQAGEALKRIEPLLSSKPKDAQLRFLKGVSLAEQNKAGDAIPVFVKLTEDFPELPEPYNNLAVLYAGQGQYDKARTALEMSIRTNPSYATAYENLGDVYAKLASQAYAKALQVDSANPAVAPKLALLRDLFGSRPASPATAAPSLAATVAAAKQPAAEPAKTEPAKPAATVAAAAAATSAATPAAAAGGTDARRDIQAAVQAWAQAWSDKDLQAYYGAYVPNHGGGKSAAAWRAERKARIVNKDSISVRVSGLMVEVDGNNATASFRQDYAAGALRVSSSKTLTLVRQGDKWLITKESVGS
jgi:Flp pilus assembly protein TadD